MMPIRICDLTSAYHPTSGGIRTFIDQKGAYTLAHTDWDSVLIVPGEEDAVIREPRRRTYTVRSPLVPLSRPYRQLVRTRRIRDILADERPDLIELHTLGFEHRAALAHCARHPGRLVAIAHTDYVDGYFRTYAGRLLGNRSGNTAAAFARRWAVSVYNKCHLIIVPDPALAQRLRLWGVQNVLQMHYGLDTDTFSPRARDERLRAFLFEAGYGTIVFLYAGRLHTDKRVDVLLNAFRGLPHDRDRRLVFIGAGPLEAELDEAARQDPRIVVLPFEKERNRLASIMASADALVAPFPNETGALALNEAKACGLGILGAGGGGNLAYVSSASGVLCLPDSVSSLREALLVATVEDWRNMGVAARREALEMPSQRDTFERLTGVYHHLIHNGHLPDTEVSDGAARRRTDEHSANSTGDPRGDGTVLADGHNHRPAESSP